MNDELLRAILDHFMEGLIIIDENENIIFINKSACDFFGLKKDDIIGTNVIDSIPNTRLHMVLRSGISEYDQLQVFGNKAIVTSRVAIKNNFDETVAAVAVFRDVTSIQKLAEEVTNLREMEAQLTSIIDSTSDAISVADEEGRVVMVNRAYTKITGLMPKEVIGKPATVDISEGESLHIKCAREKKSILNVRMSVANKEVIASVTPIFVKNEFKGSVGVIHDISELQNLMNELEATKRLLKKERAKYTFNDIVAESEEMKNVIRQAQKAAMTRVNVLLEGEYGTGKESIAQAIHNESERKEKPYVRINLSMIPADKQESLLFGENNYFIKAEGGTLFIENIHMASKIIQAKLLKYLRDDEFESPYYNHKPDVRLIFSTTEDLKTLVGLGRFSSDIFYKISVVDIKIPALRERKEDLPSLAKQILFTLNQRYGRIVFDFTEDAIQKLTNYHWNGNIRELENLIDRAILNLGKTDRIITSAHIPELDSNQEKNIGTLKEILDDYEKKIIVEMLEVCHGNKTEAAKKLGLTVRNLYYKLEKYEIQ